MQLKNWCFNKALFRKNMTRFWPIWVLSTLLWLIAIPMMVGSEVLHGGAEYIQMNADGIVAYWAGSCHWVAFVDAIVCAMAVFSYLFQHRSAVAMHMLPMRRECLFLTNYLSGLALMVLPMVINLAVTAVTEAVLGCLNWTLLLMWFTAQLMADLFFYAWAVFCAGLTGNLVMFPMLYAGLQLVPLVLRNMISSICDTLLRGFSSFPALDTAARWLSPLWNMSENVHTVWRSTGEYTRQFFLQGWKCLLIYLLVSLGLALGALAMYRVRRVETAGDVIAVPGLRPAFRYFFCFFCAIAVAGLLSHLIFDKQVAIWSWKYVLIYQALLFLGGFLGYFAAQMMLSKTLKVFHRGWAGYGVCMLILVVAVCALKIDIFGFEGWLPDVSQVESVELENDTILLKEASSVEQVVALHTNIVDHMSEEQAMVQNYYTKAGAQIYSQVDDEYYIDGIPAWEWTNTHDLTTLSLTYHMKNGSTHTRAYTVYVDEEQLADSGSIAAQTQALVNLPEYSRGRYQYIAELEPSQVGEVDLYTYYLVNSDTYEEIYVTLTGEDAQQVIKALQKDLKEADNLGNWLLNGMYNQSAYAWSDVSISVQRTNQLQTGGGYYYGWQDWFSVTLNDGWINTIQTLTDLGVLDEEHILGSEEIVGDRAWRDAAQRFDPYTHSYVSNR